MTLKKQDGSRAWFLECGWCWELGGNADSWDPWSQSSGDGSQAIPVLSRITGGSDVCQSLRTTGTGKGNKV